MPRRRAPRSFASFAVLSGGVMALIGALGGCADVTKSSYLTLAGFHVVYAITQEEEGPLRASAVFRVEDEDGTALVLTGGDTITCNGAPLARSGSLQDGRRHGYEATVPGDQAVHTFVFTRPGEPAITHVVARPVPLAVTVVPLAGDDASAELLVRWAAAIPGAKVHVEAQPGDGRCGVLTLADDVADQGALTITRARLAPPASDEGPAPKTCGYRLVVRRTQIVALGAPFHGGDARSITTARSDELP